MLNDSAMVMFVPDFAIKSPKVCRIRENEDRRPPRVDKPILAGRLANTASVGRFMSIGTLLIRADAGASVGAGHLMRCLALAEVWRRRGGAVEMVVAGSLPDGLATRIEEVGADLSSAPRLHEDGRWLAGIAEARDVAWLVVDGYRFNADYLRDAAGSGRPVLAIDDDARHARYPVTAVLNQNLHARAEDYAAKTEARLLLGPRHALIRSEFRSHRAWSRTIPARAAKILVTLGGADPGGHTGKIIKAIQVLKDRVPGADPRVRVIVGAANPRLDALQAMIVGSSGFEILSNVRDMGARMRWCDLAVSASGSTVWELALFRTPMLLATASTVEEPVAGSLADAGAALGLGRLEDLDVAALADAIAGLVGDADTRSRLSLAAGALVDGEGAERVVDQMLAISTASG
jgi:UDP-2,4-diacetamido-2,4,6-trideoxy-beta-L-altropyranose hydrolase